MREAKTGKKEGERTMGRMMREGEKNERGDGEEMREEEKYMYMYEDQSVSLATVLP